MAKHGKATSVWLDSADLSVYFNDAAPSVSVDVAETTTFSATWKAFVEGLARSTAELKGFYDSANDATLATSLRNGGSVLTVCPAGAVAIGDLARLIAVDAVKLAESSPVGGAVLIDYGLNGTGVMGFGTVLHLIGSVDTGTTTGAWLDQSAATTTGWHAHLHVPAVSSGSWVVKLQDSASAAGSHSDAADVSGGAFTAATGATAQRLSSASGATLRQYVRYVATVTGGSSPTVTFGLAVSRN